MSSGAGNIQILNFSKNAISQCQNTQDKVLNSTFTQVQKCLLKLIVLIKNDPFLSVSYSLTCKQGFNVVRYFNL